jgi:hypothetical protein
LPYTDKEKAKVRRKKYYHEVEKPKRQEKMIKLLERKMLKRIDRKKREKEARNYAWEIKKKGACDLCSESDPACLVFHHIDPSKKRASIHKLYKYGLNAVKKEIKKCRLLCSNCHMKYHYYEGNHKEEDTVSETDIEKNS